MSILKELRSCPPAIVALILTLVSFVISMYQNSKKRVAVEKINGKVSAVVSTAPTPFSIIIHLLLNLLIVYFTIRLCAKNKALAWIFAFLPIFLFATLIISIIGLKIFYGNLWTYI